MKSCLAAIGGLALLVIVTVIGFAIWAAVQLGPATKEAEEYAQETIEAVGDGWKSDVLYERADDDLRAKIKPGDLERLFGDASRIVGDLKSLDKPECAANVATHTSTGKKITANCTARAVHDRGEVNYTLVVIKRQNTWALNSFYFDARPSEDAPTEI